MPENLTAGPVTVMIRTKYSGTNVPLKQVREIVYGYPCEAKA
ncbi:MAG: hypothetical protein ACTTIZ_05090 [Treponema sp.]